MQDQHRTWNVQRPFGRTAGFGLLILVGLLIFVETGFRVLLQSGTIPEVYFSSSNPQWNLKLNQLDQLVMDNGPIDCIFIGSSQINNGIEPVLFAKEMSDKTGIQISCYNLRHATLSGPYPR